MSPNPAEGPGRARVGRFRKMDLGGRENGYSLRLYAIAAILFLLGILILATHEAEASSSDALGSCSRVEVMGVGASRTWRVSANEESGPASCNAGAAKNPIIVAPFDSITLTCVEITNGIVPPGVATTLTIRGYKDNDGFPDSNAAGTRYWENSIAGATCITPQTITVFCTTDGTSGSARIYGTVRIWVRAQRGGVDSYDDTSDAADAAGAGFYGAYTCALHSDQLLDELGTSGSSPTVYQGLDTFRSRFNISQGSAGNSGNVLRLNMSCGLSGEVTVSAGFVPSTSLTNFDATLTQVNNTFQDRCHLHQNVTVDKKSAITGWTTTPYTRFNSANLPSGSVLLSDVKLHRNTSKQYTVFYAGFAMNNQAGEDNPPTGNQTLFIIGNDPQFIKVLNLSNARLEFASGASSSCEHKRRTSTGAFVVVASGFNPGTSDATGDFPNVLNPNVQSPEGTYSLNCTFTQTPNVGFYNITFTYGSPVTSDTGVAINFNVTANATAGLFNMNLTLVLRSYDPTLDAAACAVPDETPKLTFLAFNRSSRSHDIAVVNRTFMVPLDSCSDWYYNFTTTETNLTGAAAYISFNLTGNAFLGSAGYHLNWTRAGVDLALTNVTLSTAIDSFLPLLIFGGILMMFLWLDAIFPAIVALLVLGESILPTSIWGMEATIMFLAIATMLHAFIMRWPQTFMRWWNGQGDAN